MSRCSIPLTDTAQSHIQARALLGLDVLQLTASAQLKEGLKSIHRTYYCHDNVTHGRRSVWRISFIWEGYMLLCQLELLLKKKKLSHWRIILYFCYCERKPATINLSSLQVLSVLKAR